jgi:hypothetical protein
MANPYEFTDAELSVLSQLSYEDIPVKDGQNESLQVILEGNRAKLEEKLGDGYNDVLAGLEEKVKNADYRIVKSVNNKHGSGFSAIAICDLDNNITVACRGTEGFSVIGSEDSRRDVYTDAQIGTRVETNQQKDLARFVRELEDDGYNSYTFTGHSLGGNLAMHGAVCLSDPSKLREVRTFNAPGFNNAYLAKHNMRLRAIQGRMRAYQNEYDYVSSVFRVPGENVIVDSIYPKGNVGFDHHMISGFRVDENGSFVPNSNGRKGNRTGIISLLTNGGVNAGWTLRMAFGLLTGNPPFSLAKVRDFTPEVKMILCNAAKETEEEPWWKITCWDCWYQVEKFFGSMNWSLYAGDVDAYYRKLIDINDASTRDIELIFETVYALDSSYAGRFLSCSKQLRNGVLSQLVNLCGTVQPGGEG